MTTPSGPSGFNLNGRWGITGASGGLTLPFTLPATLSSDVDTPADLAARTQDYITGVLKEQVKASPSWAPLYDQFIARLVAWLGDILGLSAAVEADLINLFTGKWDQIGGLAQLIGLSDPTQLEGALDLSAIWSNWAQYIAAPTGKVLTEWNLTGLFPGGSDSLTLPFTLPATLGGGPAPDTPLQRFTNNVKSLLTADYTDPSFDLGAAVLDLINAQLLPTGLFAAFTDIDDAITTAYQQVMDFLTSITGSTPPQQNTWLADLLTAASNLDAAKLINLLGMPPLPDEVVPGLQAIQDAASQAWSGITSLTGTDVADAQQFMTTIYNQILSHTRQLQALQSSAAGTRYAGQMIDVDFGDYPDGPLPSEFNTTYFGAGTSTLVVDDGVAAWNLVNDNNRGADVMHTVPTDTDYQIVRGSMASPPSQAGSGGTPRIWSWLRADSPTTPINGVWARAYSPSFLTYRGDIGCRVAGVDTVWASNIPLTWSLDMKVVAGVGATAKMFEVYSGDTLVKRYPNPAVPAEVTAANLSQMGAGFRYWGSRTEMKTDLFGAIGPGTIKGVSATDNLPPTLLGPTAEMYRTSTTAVSYPNSWTALPNNFWQVVARASANIDADPVTGVFTILDEGNYTINACIRIGSTVNATTKLGLWLNGSLLKATPMPGGSVAAGGALSATWSDYFLAGDEIEIATYHNGITGTYIQAESTGTETWVTVTGVNRSYL